SSVKGDRPLHDVAIAGGGMVGLSLAAAIGGLGLDVAVIEPVAPEADEQPSFDSRTTALSNGSRRVLEGIGAWRAVEAEATAIRRIHVSERGAFGTAVLTAAEQGVAALGHTIENRLLGRALRERVAALPRVRQVAARVAQVEAGADAVRLGTDAGDRIAARLLVAADGAQSAVRASLGIGATVDDYGQHAVIAHLDSTRFHEHTAYERFTPEGPIAVLPIREGRCAVVWTLAPEAARRALGLADAEFLAELQAAFGLRLGRFSRVGRRQSYPLALTRAAQLTAPRAAILGNAAQSLHPVAGQGFNLALRDVAMLAELLADARGGDPGSPALLARYANWRGPDREAVVRFTDTLVRGFALDLAPLRQARGSGLFLFDLLRPVKHEFARRTMGLAGRQPRLVQGLPLEDARA
ncbi:MAG TPA: 2-octaprenyl-6-methoxyphenyl hydroxylase, partial [Steroidobacteraceae bacterium]|nr:2-octaprenyl-6-methoxyphenyl hydroxylase [Steroidobacteraceae bacterium]